MEKKPFLVAFIEETRLLIEVSFALDKAESTAEKRGKQHSAQELYCV
jgi:hypothetical protein